MRLDQEQTIGLLNYKDCSSFEQQITYLVLGKDVAMAVVGVDEWIVVAFRLFPEPEGKLDEVGGEAKQDEGAYNGAHGGEVDAWRDGIRLNVA